MWRYLIQLQKTAEQPFPYRTRVRSLLKSMLLEITIVIAVVIILLDSSDPVNIELEVSILLIKEATQR